MKSNKIAIRNINVYHKDKNNFCIIFFLIKSTSKTTLHCFFNDVILFKTVFKFNS